MYVAVLAVRDKPASAVIRLLDLHDAACAAAPLGVLLQVEAVTPLTVLALARGTFLSVLGPLEELLKREKSPQVRHLFSKSATASYCGVGT
jgi:hypothetical protein